MAKYCMKCGRKLEEGEVCNCMATGEQRTVSQDQQTPAQDNGRPQQMGFDARPQGPSGDYQYQQQGPNGGPDAWSNGPQGAYYQQQGPYYQQNPQQGPYYQQGPGPQPYYQQGPYGNPYQPQGRTKEAEWFYAKKNAVVAGTKNMFAEILPIIKSPVTRVREIAATNDMAVGMEFIIAKTVLVLAIVLVALMMIKDEMGFASEYIKIPYLRIILVTILLTAGLDFLEALFLKLLTGLFNGLTTFQGMVNVVGARTLFDSLIILIAGLLLLVFPTVGLFAFAGLSLLLPYVEYAGYQAAIQCAEDKKPYAFFLARLLVMIVLCIFIWMMVSELATGIAAGGSGLGELLDLF